MQADIQFRISPREDLSDQEYRELIELCNLAYDEDMQSVINQFENPVHVLGELDDRLVCHALWITRYLQPAGMPILRTAYVEAVATHPDYRRRGFAGAIMRKILEQIQDYDIAGLAPFSVAYYARLGWEVWRGSLFERKDGELSQSPASERVMIYRLPQTPALILDSPISIEWRTGEVW